MEIFLIAIISLELFELYWQRGDTLKEYIQNIYYFYDKNLLLFICLHPSFYLYLFLQISFNNYSLLASLMSVIKALDIVFKISLLHKIKQNQDLGLYGLITEDNRPIGVLKYLGIALYPMLFYFGYGNL